MLIFIDILFIIIFSIYWATGVGSTMYILHRYECYRPSEDFRQQALQKNHVNDDGLRHDAQCPRIDCHRTTHPISTPRRSWGGAVGQVVAQAGPGVLERALDVAEERIPVPQPHASAFGWKRADRALPADEVDTPAVPIA